MSTQPQHFQLSRISRMPDESMHTAHTHSHCEIFYLMSGECDIQVGQTIYTITPRTAIFIPADVPHKTTYKSPNGNERFNIEFSIDYMSDITEELGTTWIDRYIFNGPMYFAPAAMPAVSAAITRLEVDCAATDTESNVPHQLGRIPSRLAYISNETTSSKPSDTLGMSPHTPGTINRFGSLPTAVDGHDIFAGVMRKLHFQEFIITLLRRSSRIDYLTTEQMQIADISVNEARKYIDHNYAEPLTLQDLADRYQLNPTYFSNKFKCINGIGFKEYLNNVRVIHAERLLLETNLPITEIALQCGYESSNYFGDVFRKINGVSPSAFRKAKGIV